MVSIFKKTYTVVICCVLLAYACSKETSYESGNGLNTPSKGTLQDTVSDCQPISINGVYTPGMALTDSNYVTVTSTITNIGKYSIVTDTVNGMWFSDSGYILNTGAQTFKLKGHGAPVLPIESDFVVQYNNTYCGFYIAPVGATIPTPTSSDYFPETTGSNWTHNNVFVAGNIDTFYTQVSGSNAYMNSTLYRIFARSNVFGKDTLYVKKRNGVYYQYGTLMDSSNSVIEFIFLQDNLPVNSSWATPDLNASSYGTPYQFKVVFTIVAQNISATIGGITFNNVIQVRRDYQKKVGAGAYQTMYSGIYSYAKNIGLVDYNYSAIIPPKDYQCPRWKIY